MVERKFDIPDLHFADITGGNTESSPLRCPRCESPAPNLHPAMQSEGEVQPCPDPWHTRSASR